MIIEKFSKREQGLLLITAILVACAFVYGFVAEPLIRAHAGLNRQIETGRLKLQKNQKLLSQRVTIMADYKRYADMIKPMASEEEEVAAMLKIIENIARKGSIRITNVRPQPVKDEGIYKEFTFELIAESDVKGLAKFIYDLQGSGNLLRVRKLTMSTAASKDKSIKAIIEITKPSFTVTLSDIKP